MSGFDSRDIYAFLMRVGELLHQHGTPSHRLERVMSKISKSLKIESVFLYTPTSLIASFGRSPNEQTLMRRVDSGTVDADKLIRFDEILEELEAGALSVSQAAEKLEQAAAAPSLYSTWLTALACGVGCATVAVFFGGSSIEVSVAGFIGVVIAILEVLQSKFAIERGLIFPVSGFVAAMASLAFARWICPIDDRLVTLASLVILLPGFVFTTALTELAVGHLSAGAARLAGACATLLTLFLGVAIAWKVGEHWRALPLSIETLSLGYQWIAIAIAPAAFAVLFRVRVSRWLLIYAVCLSGYFAAKFFGGRYGIEVGSFLGALVVGCGSNLYARWRDRPAMVPLAPGIIMLVPGSLGYRSLSALLNRHTIEGVDFAFGTILIGMSLVGGLLASSAIIPPKRIL